MGGEDRDQPAPDGWDAADVAAELVAPSPDTAIGFMAQARMFPRAITDAFVTDEHGRQIHLVLPDTGGSHAGVPMLSSEPSRRRRRRRGPQHRLARCRRLGCCHAAERGLNPRTQRAVRSCKPPGFSRGVMTAAR
jgi:hypothetical protein